MPDPDLFGEHMIERLSGVVDGSLVPVDNGSEARWARDATGRQWVRKRESDTGVEPLLAEALAYLLGERLGVRQPHAAVYHDHEWSWLSERIPGAGEHWDPDMHDLIDNIDEVGRMLALDALTFNEDRHRRNILVVATSDETRLRLWAIDSGKAEIGWPSDYAGRGVSAPSPHNHARGLPIDALRQPALDAAEVARALSEEVVAAVVAEACVIAREPQRDELARALSTRCRHAHEIVARYVDAIRELS